VIFVTVGTTQFDELVKAIDKIAPELNEEVIIQTGKSIFVPKNCKYFTFDDDLFKFFEKANLIIAHGGAGITFEVLSLGKKLISVDNPHVLDGHQGDLLGKLYQDGYLLWCKDLDKIDNCINYAREMNTKKYENRGCDIGRMITGWLE